MRVLLRKTSTYFNYKRRMKYAITYLLIFLVFIVASSNLQSNGDLFEDDLTFSYQDKPVLDEDLLYVETTKKTTNNNKRQKMKSRSPPTSLYIRTTTMSIPTLTPPIAETTPRITSSLPASSMSSAPYTYATERLNQTHADVFSKWLDKKSEELYEMTMNFSGYKLLNETYSVKLRGDAGFAWINFTEMIINISTTISEVLYNKTVIVQNLSDLVEKAFDDFRNQPERYEESANFVYYDSKSPKTFCDVQEKLNPSTAKIDTTTVSSSISSSNATTNENILIYPNETIKATTKKPRKTISPKTIEKRAQHHFEPYSSPNRAKDNPFLNAINQKDFSIIENVTKTKRKKRNTRHEESTCLYTNIFQQLHKNHQNHFQKRDKRQAKDGEISPQGPGRGRNPGANAGQKKISRRPGGVTGSPGQGQIMTRGPGQATGRTGTGRTATRRTTTLSTSPESPILIDDDDFKDIESSNDYIYQYYDYMGGESPYWNVSCINRTFDETFRMVPKGVNRNLSTIHVPTNVYKKESAINMIAYWTEALNEQFKKNYDEDPEIFWQYFCSSNGLFRRYPAAYWTVPANEDFFDCRLQSWYTMAASSPKDVLILMDRSGSMTGLRLQIAKKLIGAIMDTLSDNDFFNILTFSDNVDYLMNSPNETEYRDKFVQAGKTNKNRFIDKLTEFKNTSNFANFDIALVKSFELLLNKNLDRHTCGCNKVIMILTDGTAENSEQVFKKYNWDNGRQVRVFTFLIGRDQSDPRQVKWMACANDGRFFHIATLADASEHVHEYIPVLSRPMALRGVRVTTWSNVFVGFMDKELKIAVARPAFKTQKSLIDKIDHLKKPEDFFENIKNRNQITSSTYRTPATNAQYYGPEYGNQQNEDYGYDENIYSYEQEYGQDQAYLTSSSNETDEASRNITKFNNNELIEVEQESLEDIREKEFKLQQILHHTDEIIREQHVLLGVVGVDVPVLRLISKVSPKYQMGVGIYIIMLDNNGFIVFHPSIKKEISKGDNLKGGSASIDLDKFELPINNDDEFEQLEHDMIDQKTGNTTLDNWKRDGLRLIRRRTEYVYTPVDKTPFSVAIASPNSFGRFYIDLPSEKESSYETQLKELIKFKYETNIQLYNCSYTHTKLAEKILNPNQYTDFCIKYLFSDKDQVLAIKSDLVFHNNYYNLFNFSIFKQHPNLVRSSFYGTYSGITFYLPVTFYKVRPGLTQPKMTTSSYKYPNPQAKPNIKDSKTSSINKPSTSTNIFSTTPILQSHMTFPPSEMTINVELGSIIEPNLKTSTLPTLFNAESNKSKNESKDIADFNTPQIDNDTYILSQNLFTTDGDKHTYSFEKQYYTRSIEFSDYLRTGFNITKPFVNYFINETTRDSRKETISGTIPIWLEKVPTLVTGVVYDAKRLQEILFDDFMVPNCVDPSCRNLCSPKRGMNVSCYLVDEHGIVVLSTSERLSKQNREPVMGMPLYKVNPWLMKKLEYDGIYDRIIEGSKMPECRELPQILSSSISLKNIFSFIFKSLWFFLKELYFLFTYLIGSNILNEYAYLGSVMAQNPRAPSLIERIEAFNIEWRQKNSHCNYFGVYSFNLTKWNSLDPSEVRIWCNSTASVSPLPRKFLTGFIKHSNLIMLVVDDEFELIHCGNMTQLIELYYPKKTSHTNHPPPSESANSEISLIQETFPSNSDAIIPFSFNETNSSSEYVFTEEADNEYLINRYRKKPDLCYNFYEKEKEFLPCKSLSNVNRAYALNFYLFTFAFSFFSF